MLHTLKIFLVSGPNVNSLLRSFSHLKRLSLALVQSLEIDTSDLKIIEERSMVPGHGKETIISCRSITRGIRLFMYPLCVLLP